ncbi:frag1/DRAM/Sfk1 family domain-containing protein [Ditylenchus destructor]|nr:frag1/DRAM/Sfk1 family domain-containing protein [Ditylenchus destructor]
MVLGEDDILTVPFKSFVYIVSGLPFSALVLCIALSITLHWDESTRTHCGVPNYLPSVSAAVASYSPERYIWRLLVSIHGGPRIVLAFAFKNFLISSPLIPFPSIGWFHWPCYVACFFHLAEIIFLLLLTILHKTSFIGFIVCGLIHMFLSTWLFDHSGRRKTTSLGEKSFQYKVLCCTGSSISLFLALYFFYRHNRYCEPGVYTIFALCEYAVVIFNILFHSTLYYDFHSRSVSFISSSSTYQYEALPMHYNEKRT